MKGASSIGEADTQSLLQSVESMTSSLKLTAMSLVLQQPTIATLGLTNAVVQSLTIQRQQLSVLTQTVVTKVTPVVVPVVQVGLGQAVSAIDLGLGMLKGQGKVSVEMSEAGQVPAQGEADLQEQCLNAGFVQAGQEEGEAPGQQDLEQGQEDVAMQCMALGLQPATENAEAGQEGDEQQPGQEEQMDAGAASGEEPTGQKAGAEAAMRRLRVRRMKARTAGQQATAPAQQADAASASASADQASASDAAPTGISVEECEALGFVKAEAAGGEAAATETASAAEGAAQETAAEAEEGAQETAAAEVEEGANRADGQEAGGEGQQQEDAGQQQQEGGEEQQQQAGAGEQAQTQRRRLAGKWRA